MAMGAAPDATVRIDASDVDASDIVVRLEGRLDGAAVASARDALSRALGRGAGDVVLDCSDVECVDVTGLGLIISVHARLRAENRRLVLLGCRPQVRRALAVTRLSRILPTQTRGTHS
jgi:anti-sigma B factor antagonist